MALPQRIQEQLDQADQVLNQLNNPAPEPTEQPQEVPPVEAVPVQAPAPAPQAAPAPQPPQQDQYEALLQRHKVLQGMHRSHLNKIDDLQEQVRALSAQRPPEPPQPDTSAKDAEVFGDDLVAMVKRVAESLFGNAARAIDARMTAVERQLAGTTQEVVRTGDDMFVDRLTALVPDYEEVNVSQGFLDWLAEIDPVYGLPRQDALTAAGNARDVVRVAAIFKAYKNTIVAPVAAPVAPSLNRQVSPRAAASAQVSDNTHSNVTVAEIQAFYRDLQRGVYRGRDAEAASKEAAYNEALASGRVTDQPVRRSP